MTTKHHFSFSFVQSHVSSYKPSGPTHFFLFHLNQATKKNINSLSKLIIIKMNKLLHCIKPRLSGLQPTSTSLHIPLFTPIKQKILTRYSRDYLNIKQNMSLKVLHIPIFYTNQATAKNNQTTSKIEIPFNIPVIIQKENNLSFFVV